MAIQPAEQRPMQPSNELSGQDVPDTDFSLEKIRGELLSKPASKNGHMHKSVYERVDRPDRLILRAERSGSWANEFPGSENWTEEDRYHHYCLQFWARKLAHRLEPNFFPDCISIDPQHIEVAKVEGERKYLDGLRESEQSSLLAACERIGLRPRALETEGQNFILTPEGRVYYIDDITDEVYFNFLTLARQNGLDTDQLSDLPPDVALSRPRIFDEAQLRTAIHKKYPSKSESDLFNKAALLQITSVFVGHWHHFPLIPLPKKQTYPV